MKAKLLSLKLPDVYEEGVIEYIDGLDNGPSFIEAMEKGYSVEEYKKMNLLIDIEKSKAELKENINDLSEYEIKEIKKIINDIINKYNAIKALTKLR